MRIPLVAAVVMFGAKLCSVQASAWITQGGGIWHNPQNWSSGVPNTNASAEFTVNLTSPTLVELVGDGTCRDFRSGTQDLTIDLNASTLRASTVVHAANSLAGSAITFHSGTLLLGGGISETTSNQGPTATVFTGPDTFATADLQGAAGFYQNARFDVRDGATVTTKSMRFGFTAKADLTVSTGARMTFDPAPTVPIPFELNNGTLNVNTGGTITVNGAAVFSTSSVRSAVIAIDGSGSELAVAQQISLGSSGTATVDLRNSGVMRVFGPVNNPDEGMINLSVGTGSNSQLTISGLGSTLAATGPVFGGISGFARMDIRDGALIQSGRNLSLVHPTISGALGREQTGVGIATLSGSSTRWLQSGTMSVGLNGTGSLLITDGALLQSAGGLIGVPGIGSVSITTNGVWDIGGRCQVGLDVHPSFANARVSLESGAVLRTGDLLRIERSGTITFSGGRVDLMDGGFIANYLSPSPINLYRAQIRNGFNNGAWNGSGYGSSVAASTPGLGIGYAENSELAFSLFFGDLIDSTAVVGRLTLLGYTNLDLTVDIADFAKLAANFNATGSRWSAGDFDYNGNVNIGDFAMLAANFNRTYSPDLHRETFVPEPLGILAAPAIGLISRRRRRIASNSPPASKARVRRT